MSTISVQSSPRWVRIASRVGLAIAAVMSAFNVINGVGSLIDPTFGQNDPTVAPQPILISVMLIVFGAGTLAAIIPAWRGRRGAIWVVIGTRLAEAWSALLLPFLPGAPDGIVVFAIGLVIVGTVVAALVALGLRSGS